MLLPKALRFVLWTLFFKTSSAFQNAHFHQEYNGMSNLRHQRQKALPKSKLPLDKSNERKQITVPFYAQQSSSSLSLHLSAIQGDILRTAFGAALAAKVSLSGLNKKKSLRKSGAIAAFIVATLSLGCSIRSGATLLGFYWTSSKLTRLGSSKKQSLQEEYEVDGQRGAEQVLACSLIAIIAAVARRILVGQDSPLDFVSMSSLGNRLTIAYVAFFACCAGDTWASELGVLSKSDPRLVTKPWKKVAPGTNGGISKIGLLASAVGGLLMGLTHGMFLPLGSTIQTRIKEITTLSIVGLIGGLGGSYIDSLLGATIQITHYDPIEKIILKKPKEGSTKIGLSILSNEMVNVASTAGTALLGYLFAGSVLSVLA